MYFQLGRYSDALAQYRRYIEVADFDQERARGHGSIAWVYWRRGQLDRAWSVAQQANALWSAPAAESIIVALARQDRAAAERLYRSLPPRPWASRGGRVSPRIGEYLDGQLALADGRSAQAIEHLRAALRHAHASWNIDALEDCLAGAYLQLGRLDEAIREYERVLRINANMAMPRYHLAQALERKGDMTRARSEYDRFLQIWRNADPDVPELVDAKKRVAALGAAR